MIGHLSSGGFRFGKTPPFLARVLPALLFRPKSHRSRLGAFLWEFCITFLQFILFFVFIQSILGIECFIG